MRKNGGRLLPGWSRRLALGLAGIILLAAAAPGSQATGQQAAAQALPRDLAAPALPDVPPSGYSRYIAGHPDAAYPERELWMTHAELTAASTDVEIRPSFMGAERPVIVAGEQSAIEWQIDVPEAGFYNLAVRYYPIEGKSASIQRALTINGAEPFAGAGLLEFTRVWANGGEIRQDNRGNDIRPRQVEQPQWRTAVLEDAEGYITEPYWFYLEQGLNTVGLQAVREPIAIEWAKLYQAERPEPYANIKQRYADVGREASVGQLIKVQGEAAVRKSDPTLYPVADNSTPLTEPSEVAKIKLNAIGGLNWKASGQWLEWEVDVAEPGLYQLALKQRQNQLRGAYVSRELRIDGEVPFREASQLTFFYKNDWQMQVLGEAGEPYQFYLPAGKHTISLKVTLGELASLLQIVGDSVLELNAIYREVLMITGNVPDQNRDYQLDRQLPGLAERLLGQSRILGGVASYLYQLTGERSSQVAQLNKMAYQLESLANRTATIPTRLDSFKTNIGALGTWILQLSEQPLELDYLVLYSPGERLPQAKTGLWTKLGHELSSFFASFRADYNMIGNVAEGGEPLDVWIGTGRDQAMVLKAMIDDMFTPETGIAVNLRLVDMGMLLPATVAGIGPDVALQLSRGIPINFAFRNSAHNLAAFADYEQVLARFSDSAVTPYRYQGGVYALPEQESFNMLFYRKDILEQLELEVPQTWEDVYGAINVLQRNHLDFALPSPLEVSPDLTVYPPNSTFAMLYYQQQGEFYSADGTASLLGEEKGIKTFQLWTQLYNQYKLPMEFDFANRFRTGEMPLGVADYTFYNLISVFAPEIRGLWGFTAVPGTVREDGTIGREVASNSSAAMIMQQSEHKDDAWTFLKWWTSTEAQVRFGREMEGILGASARYPTANLEALALLPWTVRDYQSLQEQWQWVRGVPEVPGGYFTGRHLDNAFKKVVFNGENERDILYQFVNTMNEEIRLKRKEFGLD